MKKLLISTILGGVLTCPAPASIVSRGFLEETLDSYATASVMNSRFGVWRQGGSVYGFTSGSDGYADTFLSLLSANGLRSVYPVSLAEMIYALYGTDKEKGLISSIFSGWSNDERYYRGLFQIDSDLSTLTDRVILNREEISALNAKIDGKINNLSTTASNGKYVLTAVKEGDQTTYAWEPIDRSETESATPTDE